MTDIATPDSRSSQNVPEATCKLKRRDKKENLYCLISIFICEILGDQKPCNQQYSYMQLGGDYRFQKDLMTPLRMHTRQFKEMLCIAEALPAGNWSKPSEALALKWFYMLFHKNNCNKFITAGKKLKTKAFESVTKFFEAQFTTNKNNGMLERIKLEHIKKRTHLKLKNKLCDKVCMRKYELCTYRTKCKIALCNAQRRPYNDLEEQRWYNDCNCNCNCAYNDKRQAAKRPRNKCPGYCNRKDACCGN